MSHVFDAFEDDHVIGSVGFIIPSPKLVFLSSPFKTGYLHLLFTVLL